MAETGKIKVQLSEHAGPYAACRLAMHLGIGTREAETLKASGSVLLSAAAAEKGILSGALVTTPQQKVEAKDGDNNRTPANK